jgi:hypothetical protein
MTNKKKIFILIPDGVGLKNFAYSNFQTLASSYNYNVVYWNNTPFNLEKMNYDEIKINNPKNHFLTDIFKEAKIKSELNKNIKKSNDKTYNSYKFPYQYKGVKSLIKKILVDLIVFFYSKKDATSILNNKMKIQERKTDYYKNCLETLKNVKPSIVFCTNQRPVTAIAPITAAKDLNIPTATFIFSWDNLPKATMIIETDFYFVWSNHMKNELMYYYPNVKESQIFVTGTPQFENHLETKNYLSKADFFEKFGLDQYKKYICYSGDDITTCPDDPQYLEDVAKAIKNINKNGKNLGIIFRRSPADFSSRYDLVLNQFKDIIVPINPLWEKLSENWNTILPKPEDANLQINTILHSEFVINLGSSMVFDFAILDKPCMYLNYNVVNKSNKDWNVNTIYKFIHFRSMPSKDCVVWINNIDEIESKIENLLENKNKELIVKNAKEWFKIINNEQFNLSSNKILEALNIIIK